MPWIIAVMIEQGAIFIILMHTQSVYSKCKLRDHNNNFLNHTPFHPYTIPLHAGERGGKRGGRERGEREKEERERGRERKGKGEKFLR